MTFFRGVAYGLLCSLPLWFLIFMILWFAHLCKVL